MRKVSILMSLAFLICTISGPIQSGQSCSSIMIPPPEVSGPPFITRGLFLTKNGLHVYAANTKGDLFISDDSGEYWREQVIDNIHEEKAKISGIYATEDGGKIFVSTAGKGLHFSLDGGQTWRNLRGSQGIGDDYTLDVHGDIEGNLIAVASISGLGISKDGGQSWVVLTVEDGLPSNRIQGVSVSADAFSIYVATDKGFALIINDERAKNPPPERIASEGKDESFVVEQTSEGFKVVPKPQAAKKTSSMGIRPKKLQFAGGGKGFSVMSRYEKNTKALKNANIRSIYARTVGPTTHLYAATSSGLFYSQNDGLWWFRKREATNLGQVFLSPNGQRLFLIEGQTLITSLDYGNTLRSFPVERAFSKIQATDGGQVYALANGQLFKSIDGGRYFEQQVFKMKEPMVRRGAIRSFINYRSTDSEPKRDDGKTDQ